MQKESNRQMLERLSGWISAGRIDTVVAAFPDLYGRLMGKRIPARHFLDRVADAGLHACDYLLTCDMELEPLPGFAFSSWDSGYGDMHMKPDLSTLRLLPWLEGSALVLCDLFDHEGKPVQQSPRRILRKQVEQCRMHGLEPMMASELEFYLLDGDASELTRRGMGDIHPTTEYLIDYHLLGTEKDEQVLRQIRNQMQGAGIAVESSKGEWGRGQHEVNLQYCAACEMADRHVVFKDGVKSIAAAHGRCATFMAKPSHLMAGSSCHIHVSLFDSEGRNVFWDEHNGRPSERFEHFLAGVMAQARHLSVFFAHNPNSYKRYRSSSFAPVSIAWGRDNRTCGFRVVGRGSSTRIENRIPGADVNPYLAYAAILAAGIDGIKRGRELVAEADGNAYADETVARVPRSVPEALQALEAGSLAVKAFGPEVVEHVRHWVEMEYNMLELQVSDRERIRYLERI